MSSRDAIEIKARASAGNAISRGNHKVATVLGRFDLCLPSKDRSVVPHLLRDGFWESWITKWVIDNVSTGTIFLDVGANTGYYAYLAADLGARVAAFEPNPVYASLLRESGKINGLNVQVYDVALSDENASTTLHVPLELHGSASIIPDFVGAAYETTPVKVFTTTLDIWAGASIKHRGPVVVKMDAEGAEEKIWDGMGQFLIDYSPTIMVEYTPRAYSEEFLSKLESYGDLHWINYDGLDEPVSREWIQSQNDWVMLLLRKRN